MENKQLNIFDLMSDNVTNSDSYKGATKKQKKLIKKKLDADSANFEDGLNAANDNKIAQRQSEMLEKAEEEVKNKKYNQAFDESQFTMNFNKKNKATGWSTSGIDEETIAAKTIKKSDGAVAKFLSQYKVPIIGGAAAIGGLAIAGAIINSSDDDRRG